MCELNDPEELKKYTRRDFGALAASAGLLTALPGVANAVAVAEREVTITTADGICDAYFVAPTSGPAPGVLVWPDVFGLRPAFRQMGRRLAESGYSVLVVNPFYRQKKAPTAAQGGQTPIAEVMPLMQALTPAMHLSDGKAFVAWLDAQKEEFRVKLVGPHANFQFADSRVSNVGVLAIDLQPKDSGRDELRHEVPRCRC